MHYTPRFKDREGNVMIFPAANTIFETEDDAREWMIGEALFFIPFGLTTNGILSFEANDGVAEIPHIKATLGALGECCIIDGPLGPQND